MTEYIPTPEDDELEATIGRLFDHLEAPARERRLCDRAPVEGPARKAARSGALSSKSSISSESSMARVYDPLITADNCPCRAKSPMTGIAKPLPGAHSGILERIDALLQHLFRR